MDDADRAQTQEALLHKVAMSNHRERQRAEPQLILAGEVICTSCSEVIEPKRLRAAPRATRCLQCQDDFERHGWTP